MIVTTYSPIRTLSDECENLEAYQGPWKAAYEYYNRVLKYTIRQTREANFEIADSRRLCLLDDIGRTELEGIYDPEVDAGVSIRQSDHELDSDINKRLKYLGYVS